MSRALLAGLLLAVTTAIGSVRSAGAQGCTPGNTCAVPCVATSSQAMCPMFPPGVTDGDLCTAPEGPLPLPSVNCNSLAAATIDMPANACGTMMPAGVWYTVIGTGNTITAQTCGNANNCGGANFNTGLSVFCDDCGVDTCVAFNSDFATNPLNTCNAMANPNRASVSWCSTLGATYRILVHREGGANSDFELHLFQDAAACVSPIMCPVSADLSITKTDGAGSTTAGQPITYTIVASNAGPGNVTAATVSDSFPAGVSGPTWSCSGAGGGTCTASGMGDINDAAVSLPTTSAAR